MSRADNQLIEVIRASLRSTADPANAAPMQKYMKSAMPYYGIKTPERRTCVREAIVLHSTTDATVWRDTILALWRQATHREERYAAIDIAAAPRYRRFNDLDALPMYEEMIVTGAWWDLVDPVATGRFVPLFEKDPDAMSDVLRRWSADNDLWRRRAAIIGQLKRKANTDPQLLADCIVPAMASTEFFLRKGIGWALREYGKADPAWVLAFARTHERDLSALSKREALRNLIG